MSTPFDEQSLRMAVAAGDVDACTVLEAELRRGRADARAWAATILAEAPQGLLIDRIVPLLQSGPHPSAAAYTIVCAVEMFAQERRQAAEVLWREAEKRGVPSEREGQGVLHYAIRAGALLGVVPPLVCELAQYSDDDLCVIDAAELVLREGGSTTGWMDRLRRVGRKYADIAAIMRLDLGDDAAEAVAEVAVAGGHWSFAACDALEKADARHVAARLASGSRKRLFVKPHHPRVSSAAWKLGDVAGREVLRGYLGSKNPQVAGVARGEWLRLCAHEDQSLALWLEPSASDAWLIDELGTRGASELGGEGLYEWVSFVAASHPDRRLRDSARLLLPRLG